MSLLLVGYTPLLVADTTEIGRVVNLSLVESECLADDTLTETIAVAQFHVDSIGAGLRILESHLLQCRVGVAVDNPDGVCAWLWGVVGNHLVGFLVNVDAEINTAYRGNTIGVGAVEAVGRAGGHHHTCCQRTHCIFNQILHNLFNV